jgi:hypothetical protein
MVMELVPAEKLRDRENLTVSTLEKVKENEEGSTCEYGERCGVADTGQRLPPHFPPFSQFHPVVFLRQIFHLHGRLSVKELPNLAASIPNRC